MMGCALAYMTGRGCMRQGRRRRAFDLKKLTRGCLVTSPRSLPQGTLKTVKGYERIDIKNISTAREFCHTMEVFLFFSLSCVIDDAFNLLFHTLHGTWSPA